MLRCAHLLLLVASLFTSASACGTPSGNKPLTGKCDDARQATDPLKGLTWPFTVSKCLKATDASSANTYCLLGDKDLSVTHTANGKTIEIGSSGCPNHAISAGSAVVLTSYVEINGNLTFPLITSTAAFTASMRTGVAKALAVQCSADAANVVLTVVNASSSSSGGRRLGVLSGGVVVK
jgi:hypothetical protein